MNLLGLAIELGELKFRGGGRVSNWYIKLQIELVFEQIVDVPALAGPPGALRVGGGDPEPVVVLGFVHGGVGDQRLVLLLEPLRPGGAVARAGLNRKQRDLGQRRFRRRIPSLHDRPDPTRLDWEEEGGGRFLKWGNFVSLETLRQFYELPTPNL